MRLPRSLCASSLLAAVTASQLQFAVDLDGPSLFGASGGADIRSECPQPVYTPPSPASAYYDTLEFRNTSLERLLGAIRFPTVAYDDFGEPEPKDGEERDERWDTFPPFHDYLRKTYPLVHKHAKLEIVGGYSLLFTLQGTSSAPPLMLMAHQDVVAASTALDKWTYPPFAGHFDGEWIWGRGSSDCKSNLIGIMSATEHLLETGFQPTRTLLIAFGQDEEARGYFGATRIAKLLEKRYSRHGIDAIVDEGGGGLDSKYGPLIALPALAEKGYADVAIKVESFGGHSSVPGPHTSIGYLARFISALEDAELYSPTITKKNPYYGYLHCLDAYGDKSVVPSWLSGVLERDDVDEIAEHVASLGLRSRYILQTSKAATVVHGGVKNNALPEEAEVVFNSRIETTSSVQKHMDAVTDALLPVAVKYDLTFDSGTILVNGTQGTAHVQLRGHTEPSPITPWDTPQWTRFSAAVVTAFGKDTIVSPSLSVANTDTKHYWNLSTNIIRWTPARLGTRYNAHTVNEKIKLSTHLEGVKFYHELILSFDKDA